MFSFLHGYVSMIPLKFNPLSANPAKWSNTLKQLRQLLLTNCLSVFDHFVGLALKVLMIVPTFLPIL